MYIIQAIYMQFNNDLYCSAVQNILTPDSDMKKGSGSGSEMEDDKILWYPRSELNYDKNPATEKTMIRIRLQSKP